MIEFLTLFQDVFVWSYDDMSRISTDIVVHRLSSDPRHKFKDKGPDCKIA